MEGLIHCYTGDGKGKTTAAAGLALRAAGAGKKVLFTQFLKDGSSSEIAAMRSVPGITCVSMPVHFGFYRTLSEEEKEKERQEVRRYFDEAVRTAAEEKFDLLVLDEFMAAYTLSLLDRAAALFFLQNKPEGLEVVLTGRNAPEEIRALSSYVTEFRKEKHPYDRGIPARRGIEY